MATADGFGRKRKAEDVITREVKTYQPISKKLKQRNENLETGQDTEKKDEIAKTEPRKSCRNERSTEYVPEYADDIFCYYKSREKKFLVNDYIETKKHPAIGKSRRSVRLVEFIAQMHCKHEFLPETLFLAVKIADLYISKATEVKKSELNVLATASLLLAAKFEEVTLPPIENFSHRSLSVKKIKSKEREILKTLEFDVGAPNSFFFLRHLAKICNLTNLQFSMAEFALESSLYCESFLEVKPSEVAAAAVWIALQYCPTSDVRCSFSDSSIGFSLRKTKLMGTALYGWICMTMKSERRTSLREKYASPDKHQVARKPCFRKRQRKATSSD
ncbi:unnamed protein product [Caenorhabditis auriculariae]|uniref:Cyclin N-terminal domain-containing protein n=1 Tax=Caenorhabditis auriculariae TaxID=2777116 RepID=A0A8S1GWD8_9PELO|nr:unnamed protein product [Caenorhabditis auriculariae]